MDDFLGLNFHLCFYMVFTTKFYFKIPSCVKPFADPLIYFIKLNIFARNIQPSSNNGAVVLGNKESFGCPKIVP